MSGRGSWNGEGPNLAVWDSGLVRDSRCVLVGRMVDVHPMTSRILLVVAVLVAFGLFVWLVTDLILDQIPALP